MKNTYSTIQERQDRLQKMLEMRQSGKTIQAIGDEFGITRERVRQIIGNTGVEFRKKLILKLASENPQKTKEIVSNIGMSLSILKSLGLALGRKKIKASGTCPHKGQIAEDYVSMKLNEIGISNELMPSGHEYDILAGNVRIDVKASYAMLSPKSANGKYWAFKINKTNRGKYADIIICLIVPYDRFYVIPIDECPDGQIRLYFPSKYGRAKYEKWHDRFDLISNVTK